MTIRFFAASPLVSTVSRAAICLALAAPASADVTSAQVWADMKSYMEGTGYQTTATETPTGSGLTVSDIEMSIDIPGEEEAGGTAKVLMNQIVFNDNGDGTVTVQLPATIPMQFQAEADGDIVSAGTITMTQTGANMIVSGDPNDTTYDYTAREIVVSMDDLTVEGEGVPTEQMNITMSVNDVTSQTRMTVGEMRALDQSFKAASLDYTFGMKVPEGPEQGSFIITGTMTELDAASTGQMPLDLADGTLSGFVASGMQGTGAFTFASGSSSMTGDTPDGKIMGNSSSQGGELTVGIGPDGIGYAVDVSNMATEMTVPDLPFPIALQMAKSAFNLKFPVTTSDEEQDFAFGFTLGAVTVSDMIWSLFDPAGQLPRDPATISVDLTGKATMLIDVFDPAQTATLEAGAQPGEINALDINGLEVSAVGASLTGNGGLTFDNSATGSPNGMPQPVGAIDLRLEGANALIDTLVNMGLVPQDQAMAARMMMGLFGVPQGDDTLTSKIEFTEGGGIFANGQQIQ
ncbi:DUF2125 domain-containing protein [Aliishimia ponticola]|uniref:DUF2125 domain-containing protein n=1 Tax=Aliishimia ponticola TaxID=2499833 RepID=A0A4S4NCY3_9RHOB|nr:DUF2125 domain-containing protein [Aliishimia ponticola]THH36615.1 DUF2125 domain-containing protein [Aliishimia ponticola]